jgi:hypothetical protein
MRDAPRSRVFVSLLSNAIAVGMVFVLTTLFITTLMKNHEHQWYTYVFAFGLASLIGIGVYTIVYLTFGYLPMSHVGPDVLERLKDMDPEYLSFMSSTAPPTHDVGYRTLLPPI